MNIVKERAGNLAASQLKKYDWRIELFIEKCEKEGEITLVTTGEKVRIDSKGTDTRKTVKALKKYKKGEGDFRGSYSVNTKDGRTIRISSIKKSSEFGGGAGVAGGSDQTRVVEAGQCVRCALGDERRVSLGKGETLDNVKGGIEGLDESWQTCLEKIAEALTTKLPEGYWHWQDRLVQSIENVYSGMKDKLAGKFDRYNPADIWYTDQPYTSIFDLVEESSLSNLESLTKFLNQAYEDRKIVGISLKKTLSPSLESYNQGKRENKIILNNINIRPRAEKTLTVVILFEMNGKDYMCEIRRDGSSYRALLKEVGSNHYDGSVGKSIILHCLGKISDRVDECDPSKRNLLEDYRPSTQQFFRRDGKAMTATEQAVAESLDTLVAILQEADEETQKEFLGRLCRYAWSLHTRSCTFLKVS